MNQLYTKVFVFISIGFFFSSCEKDTKTQEQEEREEIMAVEDQLRNNQWSFYDISVSVLYESRAIPLLVNVADENGMVKPGVYDSYTIFGNSRRQLYHTYSFTRDDILLDTSNSEVSYKVGGYYVLNTSQLRIKPDSSRAVKFAYENLSEENKLILTASSVYTPEMIASINNAIIQMVLSDKPNDLATAFVDFLQGNEKVSKAIEQLLYNLIHGRIEEISQSPEETAEKLARAIVEKLGEIDWEEVLYERILEFMQNLQQENPEDRATELAQRVADKIEASLTKSEIYDVLLPVLEDFENESLPALASRLAATVYEKITEALSEENLYNRIYPIWEEIAGADSASVIEVADTLAGIVTAHFFDYETLRERMLPFVEEIDQTPTLKLSKLSQEIIDSVLTPAVVDINEAFPGLNLEPNWASTKPIITSVLTAIKAALGSSTVEELAGNLAEALIGVMDLAIQKGFEKAIYSLQQIPPEQAASVISSWITNLVEMAEQPVIDFIEGKLNNVFDQFEAQRAAEELAVLIHSKLLLVFSEENLYKLVMPILEAFQEADLEKIAETIAQWIIELDLISDNITEEQLVAKLAEIIGDMIGNIDPENASQTLVDLILENELVKQLDGKILKQVLETKIYELLYTIAGDLNAIDNIQLTIRQK